MARRRARQASSSCVRERAPRALARLRGWIRLALLLLGTLGLTPLAEAAEVIVREAHVAELAAVGCDAGCAEDCGADGDCADAGCHGALHHCSCCAPAPPLGLAAAAAPALPPGARAVLRPLPQRSPPERAPPPPWQPPRA